MKINLWYLSPNPYGGWVTFTRHLFKALRLAGHDHHLYKWAKSGRGEHFVRPFGYSLEYQNVAHVPEGKEGVNLIVAMGKQYLEQAIMLYENCNAKIVIHDPTEMKWQDGLRLRAGERCVVIRESMLKHLPKATFLRHPYDPYFKVNSPIVTTRNAISLSRIDFDKHTEMLLEANRLIEDDNYKIHIRGFENRIFTRFKIVPNYPEWVQSKAAWPREYDGAVLMAHQYRYMVDMSEIKGDGGGTQYSFLEAWDAGCVPVLNLAWERPGGDMVDAQNCFFVNGHERLAALLQDEVYYDQNPELVAAGRQQLRDNHDPKVIGLRYAAFLS